MQIIFLTKLILVSYNISHFDVVSKNKNLKKKHNRIWFHILYVQHFTYQLLNYWYELGTLECDITSLSYSQLLPNYQKSHHKKKLERDNWTNPAARPCDGTKHAFCNFFACAFDRTFESHCCCCLSRLALAAVAYQIMHHFCTLIPVDMKGFQNHLLCLVDKIHLQFAKN